ncbi:MAG TPA: hypothetical protein VGP85_16685 [Pyrinomonadaceae bacterium]|nr:hypothetical protein [Pyrinomonadaceae bacterium]
MASLFFTPLRFLTNDSELQNEPTPGTSAREGRSIQRAAYS